MGKYTSETANWSASIGNGYIISSKAHTSICCRRPIFRLTYDRLTAASAQASALPPPPGGRRAGRITDLHISDCDSNLLEPLLSASDGASDADVGPEGIPICLWFFRQSARLRTGTPRSDARRSSSSLS